MEDALAAQVPIPHVRARMDALAPQALRSSMDGA